MLLPSVCHVAGAALWVMVALAVSAAVLESHFARVLARPPLHFHFGRSEAGGCVAPAFGAGIAAAAAAAVGLPCSASHVAVASLAAEHVGGTVFFGIAEDVELPPACASTCSASLSWSQARR